MNLDLARRPVELVSRSLRFPLLVRVAASAGRLNPPLRPPLRRDFISSVIQILRTAAPIDLSLLGISTRLPISIRIGTDLLSTSTVTSVSGIPPTIVQIVGPSDIITARRSLGPWHAINATALSLRLPLRRIRGRWACFVQKRLGCGPAIAHGARECPSERTIQNLARCLSAAGREHTANGTDSDTNQSTANRLGPGARGRSGQGRSSVRVG